MNSLSHNRLSSLIRPAAPAPKLGRGLEPHSVAAVIIWSPPVTHRPIDTKGDAARSAFHARVKASQTKALPPARIDSLAVESAARDFRTGQQDQDNERVARNAALALQLEAIALRRRIAASLLVTAISGVILSAAAILYFFL